LRRFGFYAGYYDPQLIVRHFVPGSRLTRRYFRRWFFWHGKTQALMLDDLYPDIDIRSVPRIAGVPRFAYRQSIQQFRRWIRTLGSRDAGAALTEELHLIRYAGFFAQCWSRWLRPQPPAETLATVKTPSARTVARVLLLAMLLGMITVSAFGGPRVRLAISDGRVWLETDGATAAEILAEWARVGQTSIANGESVNSERLTLQLDGVLEGDALGIVLRSAGGFVAVDREAGTPIANSSLSRYARVVVVPVNAGPTPAATVAPAFNAATLPAATPRPTPRAAAPASIEIAPGVRRLIGPDGLLVPDDQDEVPPRTTATPLRQRGRGGA